MFMNRNRSLPAYKGEKEGDVGVRLNKRLVFILGRFSVGLLGRVFHLLAILAIVRSSAEQQKANVTKKHFYRRRKLTQSYT
jgi:hypothetical protein